MFDIISNQNKVQNMFAFFSFTKELWNFNEKCFIQNMFLGCFHVCTNTSEID